MKIDDIEHIESDLKDVSEWIGCENYSKRIVLEPISKFEKQIVEMHNTFDEFPDDKRRTNKILKLLNSGDSLRPIYVEEGDVHLFVMEGRHRMVAFWLYGLTKIPVCYVKCEVTKVAK